MKRILLYIFVLAPFLSAKAQDIRLITDLTNEYPSGQFVVLNNKVYFNVNGIYNSAGKIYSIDANDNVQLELELNSSIYELTPHDGGLNYMFIGINQTLKL